METQLKSRSRKIDLVRILRRHRRRRFRWQRKEELKSHSDVILLCVRARAGVILMLVIHIEHYVLVYYSIHSCIELRGCKTIVFAQVKGFPSRIGSNTKGSQREHFRYQQPVPKSPCEPPVLPIEVHSVTVCD